MHMQLTETRLCLLVSAVAIFFLLSFLQINFYILIAGWGRIAVNGGLPTILQKIDTKSITNDECQEAFESMVNIHFGHVCTFTKVGEGICFVSIY